jgi:hypothetical protein
MFTYSLSPQPGAEGPQGPVGPEGPNGPLNILTDVVIADSEEFQVLEFDGTNWVNAHASVTTWARNVEATTLNKGEVVYIFGGNGDHATVKRADKDSAATVDRVIGMVATAAAPNENCTIVTHGYVRGLNLSVGYDKGDMLWVGDGGGVTKTRPPAPAHATFVGTVIQNTPNGVVFVSIQQGDHLEYLHDVLLDDLTLADGDVLTYNSAVGLWENAPAAAVPTDLDSLTDVTISSTREWPGPFAVTVGAGAPTSGTGTVGAFYIDGTTPGAAVLYGPKQPENTWPLIGTQNIDWGGGVGNPVGNAANALLWYVRISPMSVPQDVWGPLTVTGVGERSVLSFSSASLDWVHDNGEFVTSVDGGNHVATTNITLSGDYTVNPNTASYFNLTLTGNASFSSAPFFNFIRPRTAIQTRASRITMSLAQGGDGSYLVTWPSTVKWPGGSAPTLSTTVGAVDVFDFISFDNGNSWLGVILQQDIRL